MIWFRISKSMVCTGIFRMAKGASQNVSFCSAFGFSVLVVLVFLSGFSGFSVFRVVYLVFF